MNPLYPIFLKIEGRPCVVVGGGKVALRKTEALLACGARVTVVAPACVDGFRTLAESGAVEWIEREFRPGDLEGARIVIAAVDDEEVNRAVFGEAARLGAPCNIVDVPDLCDFYVPSTVERGDLEIAISTNGKSPALAAGIRRMLEMELPEDMDDILQLASRLRERVRRNHPDNPKQRMELTKNLIEADDLLGALQRGDHATRDAILASWKSYLSD